MGKTNCPQKERKRANDKRHGFSFFLGVYAVVFLTITAVGLCFLWDFMDAYEQSRPQNAVRNYVSELTYERVFDKVQPLIAMVDHNLQSEEECAEMIRYALSEELAYSKLASESTDQRQVYLLRYGSAVIGKITISASEMNRYGFFRWVVEEEELDLAGLLSGSVGITIPEDYCVYVNGQKLDEGYIAERGIPFALLQGYYDRFDDLPKLIRYELGVFFGSPQLTVTDSDGHLVEITDETDLNLLLDNCDEEIKADLDTFIGEFLANYVAYTGNSKNSIYINLWNLSQYLLPGSELETRLLAARDGLIWAQSMGDEISGITVNHYVQLGDCHYLCDVTYLVSTTGNSGVVETVNNVRILSAVTESGIKAEALANY